MPIYGEFGVLGLFHLRFSDKLQTKLHLSGLCLQESSSKVSLSGVPVSQDSSDQFAFLSRNGMIRSEEGNRASELIKSTFLKGMGLFGNDTNLVAIHKNSNFGPTGQLSRLKRFEIFSAAVAEKCGGNPNIKHAWYGACYGVGVYLSPFDCVIDCALSSEADENGLRHLLLCRVILGKMEEICVGSKQYQPSSNHFDSGVDNLSAPRRHIIWSAYMNSHIVPNYVVSFRAPNLNGLKTIQTNVPIPTSTCMDVPALLSKLSRFLPRSSMVLIEKCHAELQESKISEVQLLQKIRQLAGDKLLSALIKLINSNQQL